MLNVSSAFFVSVEKLDAGEELIVAWVVAELPVQAGIVRLVDSPK